MYTREWAISLDWLMTVSDTFETITVWKKLLLSVRLSVEFAKVRESVNSSTILKK